MASKKTVADMLMERLIAWGVDTIFGYPGDGVNGLFEGLRTHQERIQFIQVRHEEAAAFAACGYAKFTRRLGVCLATSGPGGLHLLNGLYDAKYDGQPVLAITGHTFPRFDRDAFPAGPRSGQSLYGCRGLQSISA
jgi:pyruvate dehydrogenase (quinone)